MDTAALKKVIAAFLAAAMTVSLAACSTKTGADGSEKDNPSVDEGVTTEAVTEITPDLPDNLNFGGEQINIWYFTQNSDAAERFVDIQGDLNGDIVDEALYNRNAIVEEKLNVDLVFTDTGVFSSDVGNAIRSMVMSGDTTYDIYNIIQWNSAILVTEGMYRNLYNLPYVDIDKPWWSDYYINEVNIGRNNRYFLCGDISIDMIRCIGCMYFNKVLFNDYYGDPDQMYQTVLDGQWTIDKLHAYAKDVYSDINTNDSIDKDDQFGLMLNNYNNIDVLFYGAGLRVTDRDEENVPYLILNNERTASAIEAIYNLCYDNPGTWLGSPADNNLAFNNGYSLFLMGFLYTSEQLRNMEQDYGIIPSPKFEETQKDYAAVVHDIAILTCLPQSVPNEKLEAIGATLELMAYESYKTVTPAYYETAMKTKYTRDALSSQIIDLLHDSYMTDIAYVFGSSFQNLGYIGREMISNRQNNFASFYSKREKAAIKMMEKLIKTYQDLENQQ
ncbi:MAG: hypothetical protein ACOYID_06735 [Eubacteriales bacterium]|jgi:ABC-type glycerol-3-phosphate transport system substrate-binding protein